MQHFSPIPAKAGTHCSARTMFPGWHNFFHALAMGGASPIHGSRPSPGWILSGMDPEMDET
jgi:hypothetical protein